MFLFQMIDYVVSNGNGYTVLSVYEYAYWTEELDTPYSLKVDTSYSQLSDQNIKAKVDRKSIALKDEELNIVMKSVRLRYCEDEEYAMLAETSRQFLKKEMRRPKSCFTRECPKPPKDKNQIAFVGGSWSDSGEEDDEKVKDEMCLVAHASSDVCSESSYFSDENSSIDDLALDNEYDKLCKMSLR
ncbi:hypothetical protein Tco_0327918 [Tanacetum coccineum]